jgi:hypothetical protein
MAAFSAAINIERRGIIDFCHVCLSEPAEWRQPPVTVGLKNSPAAGAGPLNDIRSGSTPGSCEFQLTDNIPGVLHPDE